jgi:type II secretory pathway pseudopilin PulG
MASPASSRRRAQRARTTGTGRRSVVRRRRGDEGFALLEIIISSVILAVMLAGVGIELTTQYATIGAVRNEQSAEAVLAKALAQARAVPYEDVVKGLSTQDSTATGTSTYISRSGSTWTFKDPTLSGKGATEILSHYTPGSTPSKPPAPFYPHVTTGNLQNGISYTVRAFPTQVKTGGTAVTGLYRVTVLVSFSGRTHGTPTHLVGQTLVYSKSSTCGTLTNTNAPLSAPCSPDFSSSATAGNGAIEIKPATTDVTAIQGMAFSAFSLLLPGASASQTLTQVSSVVGLAQASGGAVGTTTNYLKRLVTSASSDLAQGSGTAQSTSATSSPTALTKTSSTPSGKTDRLTATPSTGDTIASVSSVSATSGTPCKNLAGTALTTTLPCSRGTATQAHTAKLSADVWATTEDLGTWPLASVGATSSHPNQVFSARYAAGASTCSSGATKGCITSSAQGGLGTVRLGGVPAQFITDSKAPPGWSTTNYLLQLTGYSASALAWAKSSSGTHVTGTAKEPATGSTASQLRYFTSLSHSYQTLALTGGTQTLTIPQVIAFDPSVTGGTVAISISASVSVGSKQTTTSTTSKCSTVCTAKVTVSSPVSGKITYQLTQGGTTLAYFVMTVNLGSITATASYQKPV